MKTLILRPLLLILLSMPCFSSPSFEGEEDSLYSIEISGKVMIPESDLAKNYKIELMCQNRMVDSGIVVDDEPFLLRVKKNSLYTIRITKPGYSPLVVSIDTRMPDCTSNRHKYNFDDLYFLNLYGFQLSLSLRNQIN